MPKRPTVLDPKVVLSSWTVSLLWSALAVLGVAVLQGLGALVAGCGWIGVSVPIHRQPWALVNQPGMAFAASQQALGYWLASVALPAVGALATPLVPRGRTVMAELNTLLASWWLAVVAVAWVPLLERADGHVARWLALHDLSPHLVWLAPAVAGGIVVIPALQLLGLAHRAAPVLRRGQRLALIALHLWLPAAAWVAVAALAAGGIPQRSLIALAAPLIVAASVAWVGYPRRRPDRLEPAAFQAGCVVLGLAVIAWAAVALAGRALPGHRVAGVQWAPATRLNNIRAWIEPWQLWAWGQDEIDRSGLEFVPGESCVGVENTLSSVQRDLTAVSGRSDNAAVGRQHNWREWNEQDRNGHEARKEDRSQSGEGG
jgi:hypothetical protein